MQSIGSAIHEHKLFALVALLLVIFIVIPVLTLGLPGLH